MEMLQGWIDKGDYVLRPLQAEDADDVYAYLHKDSVCRYLRFSPYAVKEEIAQLLRQEYLPFRQGCFSQCCCVQEKKSGRVIGHLRLYDVVCGTAYVEALLHPAWWGRGIMKEALIELFAMAFEVWGIEELYAQIASANTRSRKLFAALGFETLSTENIWLNGRQMESVHVYLPKKKWRMQNEKNIGYEI